MSVWDGGEIEERFSLLLLEDGEYHFRDHNCQLLEPGGTRYASQLCLYAKVCSTGFEYWPVEGVLLVQSPALYNAA